MGQQKKAAAQKGQQKKAAAQTFQQTKASVDKKNSNPRTKTYCFKGLIPATLVLAAAIGLPFTQRCGSGGPEYSMSDGGRISFLKLDQPEYPCAVTLFSWALRLVVDPTWLIPLDAEHLISKATRNTGLDSFGAADDPWRKALDQLLSAIEAEADLSPLGRFISQQQLIKSLEQRAKATRLFEQEPSVLREPLLRPLIVTGMPRTGTTLLHNLLTLTGHSGIQYLSYAATLQPAAAAYGPEHQAAISEVEQAVGFMSWMRPLFSTMHEMAAELPHEELHLQASGATRTPAALTTDPWLANSARFLDLLS